MLIDFLNELLEGAEKINDLTYLKNECLGKNEGERRAVYDLYCSNNRGEKFIVEVQRVKQQFFKDRSLYYSTFAIQEQAAKGKDWKGPAPRYELKGVYTITVLDFSFDDTDTDKLEHRIKLMDTKTHEVFYHKLTFIYLEISKFSKELRELENLKSSMETYFEEGKEGRQVGKAEGREERNIEVAINLMKSGVKLDIVASSTGLSIDALERLRASL